MSDLSFSESAPMRIRGITPAYLQATLDSLGRNALYTKKLQLERVQPKEGEPAAPDPQHTTRGASKSSEEDDPIKKAMGYSKHVRGKLPTSRFESTAAMRGPAKDFSLSNTQQLARLTAYLFLNGKYDLCSTPKDGSCLFSSVKWGVDFPTEYVTPLMRRDIVVFLAENADYFFHQFEDHIKGNYGGLRLTREEYLQKTKDKTLTDSEEYEYNHPGPFSFKEYLEYLLLDTTWGDELIIVAMSKMWQITITVVHGEDCRESRVRHDRPLELVDLVLVFCGQSHYVGASKYSFQSCNIVCVFVRTCG